MKKSLNGNLIPADHIPGEVKTSRTPIRIVPDSTPVSLLEHRHRFSNLTFVNLLLTNACNLSCHYCYEQHKRDFGRFTPDSIKAVWEWMAKVNDKPKTLQFFGGEPLIHKALILQALKDVPSNTENWVSITTNGLLLTDAFIDEWFAHPRTKMMISLDTMDASLDQREISQDKIDDILRFVQTIMDKGIAVTRFSIRATITQQHLPSLRAFWDKLYSMGVRQMVFHPLILSYSDGYLEWSDSQWNEFRSILHGITDHYPDAHFLQIVEGVGFQRKTNCLVGSNTIALDSSGDFSGCYFFTNRKGSNTGDFVIGNIFADELFLDRMEAFDRQYQEMFNTREECQTCNLRNICYQCPAGNISTGKDIFRPDGMCKKLVSLHLEMKERLLKNQFQKKTREVQEAYSQQGDEVWRKIVLHLILRHFTGKWTPGQYVTDWLAAHSISHTGLASLFIHLLNMPSEARSVTLDSLSVLSRQWESHASLKALYEAVTGLQASSTMNDDMTYGVMLHFAIANQSPAFGQGG